MGTRATSESKIKRTLKYYRNTTTNIQFTLHAVWFPKFMSKFDSVSKCARRFILFLLDLTRYNSANAMKWPNIETWWSFFHLKRKSSFFPIYTFFTATSLLNHWHCRCVVISLQFYRDGRARVYAHARHLPYVHILRMKVMQ